MERLFRMWSRRIKTILFYTMVFAGPYAWAQLPEKGAYKVDYDTNYICDYRHRLSVALTSDFKSNNFYLIRKDKSNLHYASNLPHPMYGVMLTYRWINFTGAIPVPGLSLSNNNYNTTKGFAFAVGLTGRKLYFRNFYEDYTGYQLKNPQDVDPLYFDTHQLNPDYKDFRQRTYLATFYYGFNGKKYSHRNILWQSETQKKSAGSVIVGASGGYNWFTSTKNMVPNADFNSAPLPNDLVRLDYLTLGFSVGYVHSFALPYNLNASFMAVPSLSYTNGEYFYRNGTSEKFSNPLGANGEARLQLSYNSQSYYASATYAVYAVSNLFNANGSAGSLHRLFRLTFGYHFKVKPIAALEKFNLSN